MPSMGMRLDVVDYLLKPIPFERFLRAVSKVMKTDSLPAKLQIVATDNAPKPNLPPSVDSPVGIPRDPFLYFRADRKLVKVLTNEIMYVESLKDYVKVVTASGRPLVVKHTISALEAMLPTGQFIRVHRSFIAAADKVTTYTPRHIEVAGQEIPIGRLYQQEVERSLGVRA